MHKAVSREQLSVLSELTVVTIHTMQFAPGTHIETVALLLLLIQKVESGDDLDILLKLLYEVADDPDILVSIESALPLVSTKLLVRNVLQHLTATVKQDMSRRSTRLCEILKFAGDLLIESHACVLIVNTYSKSLHSQKVGPGQGSVLDMTSLCETFSRMLMYFLHVDLNDGGELQWNVAAYAAWGLANIALVTFLIRKSSCSPFSKTALR